MDCNVLILILLDVGLLERRSISSSSARFVLILILLDVGLLEAFKNDKSFYPLYVLILILLDVGLLVLEKKHVIKIYIKGIIQQTNIQ